MMHRRRSLLGMMTALAVYGTAAAPVAVEAQQRDSATASVPARLPRDVAREVAALFNAPAALRSSDRLTIDSGRTVKGNVTVLDGPLVLSGRVTGRVLAVNSDVILQPGARIDGDLLIVGGDVEGVDNAQVGGELRVYHAPLRYEQTGDQLVATTETGEPDEQWWRRFERRGRENFNRLELATAGVYNRVEGLPVRVGPVLYRDQGWGHVRLTAQAVVRTVSTFAGSEPDVGHYVDGETRIGREYGVTLGGRLMDVVTGTEQWQLSDAEVRLASFLFHRDYRDYYRRHGGQLYLALRATDDADLTLSFSDERWSASTARDPVALLNNGLAWRVNPAMDGGRFHVAALALRIDTRNDVFNPWAGWYLLAEAERGAGRIDSYGATSPLVRAVETGPTRYVRGFLDVRRYNRLAPHQALNLRLVTAGWLSGDALPLQRRLSIDGPGTVPGFDFRSTGGTDVGTCTTGMAVAGRPAQCERIALAQLEYRTDFRFTATRGTGESRATRFRADGSWVFFADAGRGWLVNAPAHPLNVGRAALPPLSSYRTDIGGGIDFGELGLYVAKALSVPSEPLNAFVRIRHRF